MNPSLSSALLLMLVGMITVFTILGIVVLGGQMLIRLTNRYLADEPELGRMQSREISDKDVAIITAVVSELSQGRANKIKIDKI